MSKDDKTDVGANADFEDVDTAGAITPPLTTLDEAVFTFKEATRSMRTAVQTSAHIKSENWLSYCYQKDNYDWFVDNGSTVVEGLEQMVEDLLEDRRTILGDHYRDASNEHFVYLYKDTLGRAQYVGYGRDPSRATFHLGGSHNPALNAFLNSGEYKLEIAGPYGSEATARMVETALISALKPSCNINPGPSQWQFRPISVPNRFAERPSLPSLSAKDFKALMESESLPGILFVYMNDDTFGDGRVGYDIANPPSDVAVYERMNKWWELQRFVSEWIADPTKSPKLLVGLTGRLQARIVVGAVEIDESGWADTVCENSLCIVPTFDFGNLDAFGLRGRRIAPEANLQFNSIRSQIFIWLKQDGSILGGRFSASHMF